MIKHKLITKYMNYILTALLLIFRSAPCSFAHVVDYTFYNLNLKFKTSLNKPPLMKALLRPGYTLGFGHKLNDNIRLNFSYTYDERLNNRKLCITRNTPSYEDFNIPNYPLLLDIPGSESWSDLKKELYIQYKTNHEFFKNESSVKWIMYEQTIVQHIAMVDICYNFNFF